MKIDVVTVLPEMFQGPLTESIIKRACQKGLLEINIVNLRDFTHDRHRTTDDYPFGGGAGMVMRPEPLFEAVEYLNHNGQGRIVLMCPQGRLFNQELAQELAGEDHLIFICGHYEGVDERVRTVLVNDEISIGDYVLTGGEIPAMVVIDTVARLVPEVLGEAESIVEESFGDGLLEYPQYTRPREYQGLAVPEVLLSGNHEKIRCWRRQQSLLRTLARRPELLQQRELSTEDRRLLDEALRENSIQVRERKEEF